MKITKVVPGVLFLVYVLAYIYLLYSFFILKPRNIDDGYFYGSAVLMGLAIVAVFISASYCYQFENFMKMFFGVKYVAFYLFWGYMLIFEMDFGFLTIFGILCGAFYVFYLGNIFFEGAKGFFSSDET